MAPGEQYLQNYCRGAGACLFFHGERERKESVQVWIGVFPSAAKPKNAWGIQVGIQSGTLLNLGQDRPWPNDSTWTQSWPKADMLGAYIPAPPQASCVWQSHGDVNPWLQDLQFLHQVENVIRLMVREGDDHIVLCLCPNIEGDRDWEHAPQGDWDSAGSVQPQRTWSQQALGLWGRGVCSYVFSANIVFTDYFLDFDIMKLVDDWWAHTQFTEIEGWVSNTLFVFLD